MIENGIEDYDQAFWKWFSCAGVKYHIINGYVYVLEGHPKSKYADATYKFVLVPDPLEIILVKKAIRICKAPPEVKDTARLISNTEYIMIRDRFHSRCNLKGCLDRYHCVWYNMECDSNGPWNTIPEDWIVGGERCESFIDKTIE